MKKKVITLVGILVIFSVILTGCTGGIAEDLYDAVAEQLDNVQSMYDEAQQSLTDKTTEIADLEAEIESLKEQYELVGDTTEETVANIARYYHETHEYSATDLFVCGDMASEVWNMLKAQDINAIVVVGSIQRNVTTIIQSDHAWVLAEVNPGEYLAVETTAGVVKPRNENPLYYTGWYYENPSMIKDYQFWVKEYNTRVEIHNEIVDMDEEVVRLYNTSTNQTQADKYMAVHEELTELLQKMEADMTELMSQINSQATKLG